MSAIQAEVSFQRLVLTDQYYCDGINAADIDGDGRMDVVAGPFWYAGPDFQQAHAIYPPRPLPPAESPSNSMFSFVDDFSGDGRPDILVLGRVHKHKAAWYQNPGDHGPNSNPEQANSRLWQRHVAFHRVKGESPTMGRFDVGLGQVPQVLCHWQGRWGVIHPNPKDPFADWQFKPWSHTDNWPQFYHGQGMGDVDGDGLPDLIINDGWFRQPAAGSEIADSTIWKYHPGPFSQQRGGAQMYCYDVDGDGDNDVISAVDAHGWGLAWHEQIQSSGRIEFREHLIMGSREQASEYGLAFSQPHALALADINGDGLKDVVAGKRRWAHGPSGDVEPNAAPIVCWFQLQRQNGRVRYIPHVIDRNSGVGVQIKAKDVNGDGRCDVLTASKLGTFVFLNMWRPAP